MAKYNTMAGTIGRIPAHYPQDAPIPPLGSVTLYRNLNDQQLYTVTPAGIHSIIGAGGYVLPAATVGTLGGVKTGANVTILPDGTISVAPPTAPYVLPAATAGVIGGVKPGTGLTVLPDGTLNAAGGGITSIPVANTLFVSESGNDGTAVTGRFDLPYLTIEAAVIDAGANDLIVVYPGTYDPATNLWKADVSFYFYPEANIVKTVAGDIFIGVAGETCSVFGSGNFTQTANEASASVYRTAVGAIFHLEANDIKSDNKQTLRIQEVAHTYVKCNSISSGVQAVYIFAPGGDRITNTLTVDANIITNEAVGNIPVIDTEGVDWDGLAIIKANKILGSLNHASGQGGIVIRSRHNGLGELRIICNDIDDQHTLGAASIWPVVQMGAFGTTTGDLQGTNITHIIGNIYSKYAIGVQTTPTITTLNSLLIVDGNITCDNNYIYDAQYFGANPTINLGSQIFLNGTHKSGATAAMRISKKNRMYFTGRLEGVDVGISKVFPSGAAAIVGSKLYFSNYVIYMSAPGALSISADTGSDVYYVVNGLSSNVPPGGAVPAITNGIAGSTDIQDPLVA